MFARPHVLRYKRLSVWQLVFCLTVVAFLCRAIIPAGYMPGNSGERGTLFPIIFCTAGGPSLVQFDLSTDPHGQGPEHRYGAENCVFGLSVAQKVLPGAGVAWAPRLLFAHFVQTRVGSRTLTLANISGPPLGSRAPPFHSM